MWIQHNDYAWRVKTIFPVELWFGIVGLVRHDLGILKP